MSETSGRQRGAQREGGGRAAPRHVEEALLRARDHARAALAEAMLAARCLLDAASLGATGVPAEGHEALRHAAQQLDRAAAAASGGASGEAARWLTTVADALDAEIARWETRSRTDPEARAVLRAFLSVRELLWEFGLRRGPGDTQPAPPAQPRTAASGRRAPGKSPTPRLERVPVHVAAAEAYSQSPAEPAGRVRADRSGPIR